MTSEEKPAPARRGFSLLEMTTPYHRRMRMATRPTFLIVLCLVVSFTGVAWPRRLQSQTRSKASPSANEARARVEEGLASYYANRHHGRRTASGERFDNTALVAAHPSLPFGTRLRVTNLANGRSVEVRIVDRGPSAARQKEGYVIDLSRAAARTLGFVREGRARVRLAIVDSGSVRTRHE